MGAFEEIDEIINTGKYSRYDYINPDAGNPDPKKEYNQCNFFVDDIAKKYWDVKIPRLSDDKFQKSTTSAQGVKKDWPNNPMSAVSLEGYYRERDKLMGSGVKKISAEEGRQRANNGDLVLVLGGSHSTIMAPSEENWPLIYRQDMAYRKGDKRTRVGMKNKEHFDYYAISPGEYKNFNKMLKRAGFVEKDIYVPYNLDSNDDYVSRNERYEKLHTKLRKTRPGDY